MKNDTNSASYTPGPWKLRTSYCGAKAWIDTRTDNSVVELRGVTAEGRLAFEANARLIAAAPELLIECRYALAALKGRANPTAAIAGLGRVIRRAMLSK